MLHPLPAPLAVRGRATLLIAALLTLAGLGAVLWFASPWNALRFGRATPPLPDRQELEAPLQERLDQRLAAVRENPYDGTAWGKLGECYEVHEFFPQAIECYQRAARLSPEEARWPYWLGIALRIGDQAVSTVNFQRAAQLAPEWAGPHFYLGHGLLAQGDHAGAAREFERALALRPDDVAILVGAAQAALAKGDGHGALGFLERAGKGKPRTGEWRWLAAAAWRALGDEAKALEFARPDDPPPTREPFADELREKLLWDEGATLALVRQRADRLLGRGEGPAALQELEDYLRKSPRSVAALGLLGDKYMQLGRHAEAAERYQIACTLDPAEARALSQWGVALARQGKRSEAVAKLRQATALDAASVEARTNLGSFLCGSQVALEREEGLKLLGAAMAERPDDLGIRINFAQALRVNGRAEEALAAFRRALELAPEDSRVRFEFAVLCAEAGHMEEAEQSFAKVVLQEPNRPEARSNWVEALLRLGRYQEATAALRAGIALSPKDGALRAQLAWLLATATDDRARSGSEALALAQELSLAAKNENPELLVILAAAQAESGDLAGAEATVASALELLRPKSADRVTAPEVVGIIDNALACRKAFQAGTAYRATPRK
ncbi:MAG: tetratricopeptide repeat protein [Planctomycetes bacterium]|nr:tetratricopeptide repeat protein [Planctomycetota bacterium]